MRLYPALEGVSKMVAPGGVTLSGHFIPGGTNIMVKRDMKHTFMLLLSLSLPSISYVHQQCVECQSTLIILKVSILADLIQRLSSKINIESAAS